MKFSTFLLCCLSSKHARSPKRATVTKLALVLSRSFALPLYCAWHLLCCRSEHNNKSTLVENENDHNKEKQAHTHTHTRSRAHWVCETELVSEQVVPCPSVPHALHSRNSQTNVYRRKSGAKKWMSMNVVYRFLVEFCYFTLKYVRAKWTDCERSGICLTCAACQINT